MKSIATWLRARVDEAKSIKRLNELLEPLQRLASSQGKPVALDALMRYVLITKPSDTVRELLASYAVRLDRIDLDGATQTEPSESASEFTEEVARVISRACFTVEAAGRSLDKTEYADFLVAVFAEPAAARALEGAGLTRLKITYYLSHVKALPAQVEDEINSLPDSAQQVWLRIHNDDYSQMQLVTELLVEVFHLDQQTATATMEQIHDEGQKLLGPYTPDSARTLALQAIVKARNANAPLAISLVADATRSTAAAAELHNTSWRNPYAALRMRSKIVVVLAVTLALAVLWNPYRFQPVDDTLKLARQLGIAQSVLDKAHTLARPALHLQHSESPRLSWIGGSPSVPAGVEWPRWREQPLTFVAQLDLEDVTAAFDPGWLPKKGQLFFFFYIAGPEGEDYDLSEREAWRVIHTNVEHSALVDSSPPAELPADSTFPKAFVEFRRIQSMPSIERTMHGRDLTNEELESMWSAQAAPFLKHARHQMFGNPRPEQSDDMELESELGLRGIFTLDPAGWRDLNRKEVEEGAGEWRLLLQIDTDDELDMMWGDGGLLYFWIREQDARRGEFSKVWMSLQQG